MQSSHLAVKMDIDFGLQVEKIGGAKCIEVKWNKLEAGACYVQYEVVVKSASGIIENSSLGYNIGNMTMCSFATFRHITDVQVTVSFKATSKIVTAKVTDTPISTPASATPGMTHVYSI